MNGEWCYFRSYLSKEDCENIIKTSKLIQPRQAALGFNDNAYSSAEIRRSQVRFVNNGDWRFQSVFDTIWKTALEANKDFFNFHLTKLDFLQIAEYDASYKGEYKMHHDVFWLNGDPHYHRKLTCLIQLSDPSDYEGGDFELFDVNPAPTTEELKAQGTVIFFPSFFRHQAHPVTKGTRYSIAAWIEGPKWR